MGKNIPDIEEIFWLDEIYANEPINLTSTAYWGEGELKTNSPIYTTDNGLEIGNNFYLKYISRGEGENFSSPGKATTNKINSNEITTSLDITKNLKTALSISEKKFASHNEINNSTDPFYGNNSLFQLSANINYTGNTPNSTKLLFNYSKYNHLNNYEETDGNNKIYIDRQQDIQNQQSNMGISLFQIFH